MNWRKRFNNIKGRRMRGGTGPGGSCICVNPNCRHKVSHTRGVPCYKLKCSQCSSPMVRE